MRVNGRLIRRLGQAAIAVAVAAVVAVGLAVTMGGSLAQAAPGDGTRSAHEVAGAPGTGAPGDQAGTAGTGAPGDRAARIERARQQVLDDSYQADLPGWGSGSAAEQARRGPVEREREERIDAREHIDSTGGSRMATVVLWGLVIVFGALIAFWLASELARFGGDAELPLEDDDAQARLQAASAAIIDRPLGDADELARRGEFAEAIHTLLLRTLHELARNAAVRIVPAMTSREVLARVPLLADSRSALAGLITAVEITYFGDEPANAADYERCRQQFHVFAAAFRGRAALPGQAVAA